MGKKVTSLWLSIRGIAFVGVFLLGGCDSSSAPKNSQASAHSPKLSSHESDSKSTEDEGSASKESAPLRIGILDFNKVWHEAKAPQQIREAIQAKRRAYQKEIITLEEKLRLEELNLQKEHEKLSAADYQERRKKFESQVLDVQKQAQAHKKGLEKSYTDAMALVSERLNDVIKKIAQKKHLTLILSQTQVAFTETDLDITPQVMADLDQALPSVELSN